MEVREVREEILKTNHLIKTIKPMKDEKGEKKYIVDNKVVLIEKSRGVREYLRRDDPLKILAKTITDKIHNGDIVLEIRYFDDQPQHFCTDYFDSTGRPIYAEYDRDRINRWEPLSHPFPFIIPTAMLFLGYGF